MNDNINPADFTKLLAQMLTDIERARLHLADKMEAEADNDAKLSAHASLAQTLAAAAVNVSKEARTWAKQAKELGRALSLQERMDLCVAFLLKLTPQDRSEVIQRVSGAR